MSRLTVAAERIREVGELLVERSGVEPGMRVLDVGTGTGNAAVPAAKMGARVTGIDDAPELLAIARERGADEMIELEWAEASPAALPFDDGEFDRVLSAFGHMFVPDQEAVAAELRRVCAPDGVLGLAAWTPDGLGGRTLAVLAEHLPPPSEYAAPPTRWGEEGELLGSRAECERHTVSFEADSAEEWFEFTARSMAPFVAARESLSESDWFALRDDLVGLFREHDRLEHEYLLAIVRL